ncbi:hypothetical protein [Microbacterium sp. NPDC079995]|uniref:hypothetical protein n=1 Tax=unclassified Microbacterium TaxID=2609290 RepID=UPI00344E71FA
MIVESLPVPAPAAAEIAPARDWRPSRRARGITLAVGGAAYALSHILNLFGSTPGLNSPTEIAAKVLFAAGALLIMAGLSSLLAQFRRSPLGVLGVQLTWVGMLFIPLSAYSILFIYPAFGWEGLAAIEENAALLSLLTIPTVLAGPVLLSIAAWRHRVMAWWNASLLLLSVIGLMGMMAVPELEPVFAISSTIVAGVAYMFAGVRVARRGASV